MIMVPGPTGEFDRRQTVVPLAPRICSRRHDAPQGDVGEIDTEVARDTCASVQSVPPEKSAREVPLPGGEAGRAPAAVAGKDGRMTAQPCITCAGTSPRRGRRRVTLGGTAWTTEQATTGLPERSAAEARCSIHSSPFSTYPFHSIPSFHSIPFQINPFHSIVHSILRSIPSDGGGGQLVWTVVVWWVK